MNFLDVNNLIPVSRIVLAKKYQLIDFGRGRKLEQFGGKLLDRPCPAADGIPQSARHEWQKADLRYEEKKWFNNTSNSEGTPEHADDWVFCWNNVTLILNASPFGHVGVFPEQLENWEWISRLGQGLGNRSTVETSSQKPTALNLFAYTGGSTLALATSGFEVTHVDASKPAVQWARRNAEKSNSIALPIRWIVDDARDYVQRIVRRNQKYDLIVLDPPAFGHGASGKRWEMEKDLADLMEDCRQILSDNPIGILLTGHSPIDSMELGPLDKRTFSRLSDRFQYHESKRATLRDQLNRELDCGYIFRWFNR